MTSFSYDSYDEPYYIADHTSLPAKSILDGLPSCAEVAHQKLLYDFHTQLRHDKISVSDWQQHVTTVRESSGFDVIKASLLSGRSVSKPRGYAGDAVMIDSIYGIGATDSATEAGQRTYHWELHQQHADPSGLVVFTWQL